MNEIMFACVLLSLVRSDDDDGMYLSKGMSGILGMLGMLGMSRMLRMSGVLGML